MVRNGAEERMSCQKVLWQTYLNPNCKPQPGSARLAVPAFPMYPEELRCIWITPQILVELDVLGTDHDYMNIFVAFELMLMEHTTDLTNTSKTPFANNESFLVLAHEEDDTFFLYPSRLRR